VELENSFSCLVVVSDVTQDGGHWYHGADGC